LQVELRNAEGWRLETNQIISDITARLLTWMSRFDEAQCGSSREVAVQIGVGLQDLVDAQATVVYIRHGNILIPAHISWSDPVVKETDASAKTDDISGFDASALFALLPDRPFFYAAVPPALQVILGELFDGLPGPQQEDSATDSKGPIADELILAEPSLVIPLTSACEPSFLPFGFNTPRSEGITGLVVLWATSTDGLLPETLRTPLEASSRQASFWLNSAIDREQAMMMQHEFSAVLSDAIDDREPHRDRHSRNVAHWCGVIARDLQLGTREIEIAEMAGLLHGIGKIGVPDAILQTEQALSPDQREGVRMALVSGGDRLRAIGALEEVSLAVRHQGERWDGKGYPDGLSGDSIPIGARILSVAQRFCAMTRARPERRAMSVVGGAFEALAEDAGHALDPRVVQALLGAMGRTFLQ
jgi:HD-GYP domain-containing protein (c-di-GMP phosphodiesterase class II)